MKNHKNNDNANNIFDDKTKLERNSELSETITKLFIYTRNEESKWIMKASTGGIIWDKQRSCQELDYESMSKADTQ
ncbi:hypothetical protein RCL_jg15771.t1 [Rhizophagus clarus]|uniref:Uncharacterized protein n=1 Tax=Rhizophagus clarus TaxID=94130 RepID=A0A8H3R3L7_9GLOM|nr:hypothetical protein RCL_jg15771.t1 [Rhizophagus clarus]